MALGAGALLVAVPVLSLLQVPAASAATIALVQSASAQGSNATPGSAVLITTTLAHPCTAGDTLIAFVTVAEQASVAGQVIATPAGWQRLYEHAPSDTAPPTLISPYQGWFALSNCSAITEGATFSITSPGDSAGTSGSVVLSEYSGLSGPLAVDFAVNGGSPSTVSSSTLSGEAPTATGELTLTALSFYGSSPTSTTPSGWSLAGSETATLPAFAYWKVGTTSTPTASFSWSPSSSYEVTMLALKAGPPTGAENVVQENQGSFADQSSWAVALPNGVSAGDSLVALIGTDGSGSTGAGFEATKVSGGAVTWQQVTGYVQSGNGTSEVWVGFGSTGTSGSTAVTATLAGAVDGHMVVAEVSGIAGVDASSANHGATTAPVTTSITPHAGDFLVGMLTTNPSSVVAHPTPDWSTFSLSASSYAAEWQSDVLGTGSTAQWATTPSGDWIAVEVAFTTAPSSGAPSAVGGLANGSGNGVTTLAVSPQHVGDLLALVVKVDSATVKASTVSGGGVGTWGRAEDYTGYSGHDLEIWTGTVTTSGASTVTVGYSASVSAVYTGLSARRFAGPGSGTVWGIDTGAGISNASSTTAILPSLTPAGPAELYFGYAAIANTGSAGTTSGFTYATTSDGDVAAYDTSVSATVQPTATQSPAGLSGAAAVLITASGAAPSIPTVSAVSPSSGPTAGGTSVTVSGTNFTGVTAVKFGTASATGVTVNSTTSITATAPAGSGTVDVTVTASGGTTATSSADHYTYAAAPTVTAVSPTSGPTSGGTPVTITGTNLTGASAVKFGTTVATGVTVTSATSVTATAPAGSGTVDVTVTTPGGSSATSSADQFTYVVSATPTVTGLSPTSGPTAGGTSVTVTGTNFGSVTAVKFGTVAATATVTSATSITATAPAGSGTVDVTVTGSAGTSATSGADQFTYTTSAATISAVGTLASKSGTATTTLAVTPQHVGDLLLLVVKTTSTTISASSVGGGGVGTWTRAEGPYTGYAGHDLEIWTGTVATTGSSTITVTFSASVSATYTELAAQEFSASSGSSTAWGLDTAAGISNASSTTVTSPPLTPSGSGELYLAYDGVANTGSAGTTSGFTYSVTSDADVATYDTSVSTAVQPTAKQSPAGVSGAVAVLVEASSSVPAPTVSGLNPASGPTAGGTSVVITGTNLTGASAVKFGTAPATGVTVNSATSVTATAPAGSGTVDVTVTTPGGTSGTGAADQFTYTVSTTPTVSAVSPSSGPVSGGTSVTVTGTNFSGVTAVKFGTAPGTGVTVTSTTSITVTAPAGSAGTVDVTVVASGGTSATTSADSYTYVAAPTVSAVSPSSGSTAGGTPVTITGTNFTTAQAVEFGTVAATSFTVNSATSITATPKAESAGPVDVTVLTPGGTSATSPADQYTYIAPPLPTVTSVSPSSGPTSGGTSVVITGTNLTGATGVMFGNAAATTVTVTSATSITVTVPAGAAGTVDVTVTTPSGTSATGSADHYTYVVSTVTITAVGTLASKASTGVTTLAVSPQHVGDLLLLAVKTASTTISASSVSGGGVGTWTRVEGPYTGYAGYDLEIWKGTVSTTGSSTVTVAFSASVTSIETGLLSQEFSSGAGAGTSWGVDTGAGISNASSTGVTFPKLTPSGTGELYFGYDAVANSGAAGATSGFSYGISADGDVAAYDTNVSAAVQPTAAQSPAGVSGGVAVLVTASGSTVSAPTVTSVSPGSGSTAGGTSVTITGTNLTGASSVMFGTTAATSVTVNSATSITATSPAEPAWQTDVTVTASGGTSATGAGDKFTFVAAAPVPTGTPHVMVVMMENESYSDLIGNSAAPNVNHLAQDYSIATQSYAIGHPSLPNYIELLSGSNYGVTDDGTPQSEAISSSATTLANQLNSAGISWRGYLESMPSAGYTGGDAGGTDPYGGSYYLQHHNPFVYFPAVTALSDFDANVVPLSTNFASDLNSASPPDFVWVTPNAVDDMHDGPVTADGDVVPTVGDAWLGNFLGGVQASSWYAAGGQVVIEFDEGADSDTSGVGTAGEGGGGLIPTLVVSAALETSPQKDATPVNTAGVLHSIEKLYGVPSLVDAANTANGNIDSLLTAPPSTTPTVTAVSPTSGPTAGATPVTITGTNFTGVTAVKFGTVAATGVTVTSTTSITATAPAGSAGSVDVTVVASGGTSATSSADHYTYAAAPTVTSVVPGSGPTGGGTSVTITGTNLAGATGVRFGTASGTGVVVSSATSVTATAPTGSGTVDVTVTTPGGTSPTSSADQFTYVVSTTPTVSAVSPASGPVAGGTSVTITGTNFTGVTAVDFGTAPATGVTVTSTTSITATAPAGSGTVDVTVAASGGTSATGSADRYTYTSAAVTISAVGTLTNKTGNGTTSLAVSPQHAGDLLVLVVKADATGVTASSVSGGGVGSWTRAEGPYTGYASHDLEIWTGTVSTAGASTITVTFSASVTATYTGLALQEFSASSGSSTVWGTDTGAGISNASSTTVTFATLTPSASGELYVGFDAVANSGAAGTTSGFSYSTTSDGDVATYDTDVSAAVQPTAKQSPAGVSGGVAVLITATG